MIDIIVFLLACLAAAVLVVLGLRWIRADPKKR